MPFQLDPADPTGLTAYLRRAGLLGRDEAVTALAKAGEGNMNLTLRATVGGRSLVVKQARGWVEKYPQIPAPVERAEVEAAFYRATADRPDVAARMPRLLHHDADAHLLVLEDLGRGGDLSGLYAGEALTLVDLDALLAWLAALHAAPAVEAGPLLANRAMRELNHAHVFHLPFQRAPMLDLDGITQGLAAEHARVVATPGLRARLSDLGARYLSDGPTLLHGDVYPGSFLRASGRLWVIDPEFAFLGDPAFDRGVLLAHLVLARQDAALVARAAAGSPVGTHGFAAAEILRRLLGVAQLPLPSDLAAKTAAIDTALAWLEVA